MNAEIWKNITQSLEKLAETTQERINTVDPELDKIQYSKRSLLITELSMIKRFIQSPERIEEMQEYLKSLE